MNYNTASTPVSTVTPPPCAECSAATSDVCLRCNTAVCSPHTADGELCAACATEWMSAGDTLPVGLLLILCIVAVPTLLLFNPMVGMLLLAGGALAVVSIHRSGLGERRYRFIRELGHGKRGGV